MPPLPLDHSGAGPSWVALTRADRDALCFRLSLARRALASASASASFAATALAVADCVPVLCHDRGSLDGLRGSPIFRLEQVTKEPLENGFAKSSHLRVFDIVLLLGGVFFPCPLHAAHRGGLMGKLGSLSLELCRKALVLPLRALLFFRVLTAALAVASGEDYAEHTEDDRAADDEKGEQKQEGRDGPEGQIKRQRVAALATLNVAAVDPGCAAHDPDDHEDAQKGLQLYNAGVTHANTAWVLCFGREGEEEGGKRRRENMATVLVKGYSG